MHNQQSMWFDCLILCLCHWRFYNWIWSLFISLELFCWLAVWFGQSTRTSDDNTDAASAEKKNWVLIVQCDLLSRCLTYTKNPTAYISQLLMHIIWYSLLLSDQQKRRVFIGWNEVLCLPVARYSLCMLKVPLNTKQTNKQYTVLHYAENCSVID